MEISVQLGAGADDIGLAGVVRDVGVGEGTGAPAELEVEIVRTHAHRVNYLLAVLEGRRLAGARAHRRVPVSLEGRWIWGISPRSFHVTEIGAGGVFVDALNAPRPGSRVELQIRFDARLPPIFLRSEVMWISRSVQRPGFGARFRHDDPGAEHKLEQLIRLSAEEDERPS